MAAKRVVGRWRLEGKPRGGFRFITVTQLALVWCAYREGLITGLDVRVYFAAHAVAETRYRLEPGRTPRFALGELQRPLGPIRLAVLKASVAGLEAAALLRFSPSEITFAEDVADVDPRLRASVAEFLSHFKRPKRAVPVPRQTLVLLASRFGRAWTATVLGELVRRLRWVGGRNGERGIIASGLTKASWIAAAFGVSLRGVKAARADLVACGWLKPESAPQWTLNRWGARGSLNLDFSASSAAAEGRAGAPSADQDSAPPQAPICTNSAPPESKQDPLRGCTNQSPALPAPPSLPATAAHGTGFLGRAGEDQKPSLENVTPEDLQDTGRLRRLFEEAVKRGLVPDNERAFRDFVGLAERARRVGTKNPPGLFIHLLKAKRFEFIAGVDEDQARTRVRDFLYGSPGPRTSRIGPLDEEARRRELQRQLDALRRRAAA